MGDDVAGVVWSQVTPWGVVTVFVMFLALGWLIPRWFHIRELAFRDKLIEKLQTALDRRDEQFTNLFEQNQVIVRLLEDIKATGHRLQHEPEKRPL